MFYKTLRKIFNLTKKRNIETFLYKTLLLSVELKNDRLEKLANHRPE